LIDQVRDGSNFRVTLILPANNGQKRYQYVNLTLTGIKAPAYRVGVPNVEDLVEPYSEEAKYFVESRLLQREVKVLLEGVSQNGGLIGTILHPNGNISEALLGEGLATIISWNIAMVTGGPAKLRAAEQKGKDRKLRLWKNFVAKKSAGPSNDFDAIVTRIIGADSFTVVPASNPEAPERKIYLASIKAPKQKEAKEAHYFQDAKEVLHPFKLLYKHFIYKLVLCFSSFVNASSEKLCTLPSITSNQLNKVSTNVNAPLLLTAPKTFRKH
jgi:staphylococcal nuclease domain-containing protein 1